MAVPDASGLFRPVLRALVQVKPLSVTSSEAGFLLIGNWYSYNGAAGAHTAKPEYLLTISAEYVCLKHASRRKLALIVTFSARRSC